MKLYRSKLDWIAQYVDSSKSVLDLGCVCHDLEQTAVPWLHGFLCDRAGIVFGVDYLDDAVAQMQADGYNAVCANVETMELTQAVADIGKKKLLPEKFDLIVAGDIIEHLDNVGLFLDRVRAYLADDGMFLVTTPNPVNCIRINRAFLKGSPGANKEHTCWFTAKVLRQLAERHGFVVTEEAYIDDSWLFFPWFKPQKKGSPSRKFLRQISRFFSMLFIWKPLLCISSICCKLQPRLGETLCLALKLNASSGENE